MAKVNIFAILSVLILSIATVSHGGGLAAGNDELRAEYNCLKNEELAKIHFYIQDITGGPNSTVDLITSAAVSSDALLSFGSVYVIDDIITAAPDADSAELGKSQGTMTSVDMNTTVMAMNFNVVFTSGMYNGSTLSFAGRNHVMDQQRRLSVIGGTGVFRYTRGHAVVSTYSLRRVGKVQFLYTILEYTVYATYCPST